MGIFVKTRAHTRATTRDARSAALLDEGTDENVTFDDTRAAFGSTRSTSATATVLSRTSSATWFAERRDSERGSSRTLQPDLSAW